MKGHNNGERPMDSRLKDYIKFLPIYMSFSGGPMNKGRGVTLFFFLRRKRIERGGNKRKMNDKSLSCNPRSAIAFHLAI